MSELRERKLNLCEGERHTNSSRLNHVADGEALDRLVLGGATRAVAATDGLHVATALLVATTVDIVSNLISRQTPSLRVIAWVAKMTVASVMRFMRVSRVYRTCSFSS